MKQAHVATYEDGKKIYLITVAAKDCYQLGISAHEDGTFTVQNGHSMEGLLSFQPTNISAQLVDAALAFFLEAQKALGQPCNASAPIEKPKAKAPQQPDSSKIQITDNKIWLGLQLSYESGGYPSAPIKSRQNPAGTKIGNIIVNTYSQLKLDAEFVVLNAQKLEFRTATPISQDISVYPVMVDVSKNTQETIRKAMAIVSSHQDKQVQYLRIFALQADNAQLIWESETLPDAEKVGVSSCEPTVAYPKANHHGVVEPLIPLRVTGAPGVRA